MVTQREPNALERVYYKSGAALSPVASLYAKDKDEQEKKKNRGGLLGGLGYVGEKLGLGFLQGIEGVWDYAAGGIADLFGADAWAERQFSSDWLNYNHADDWYNPGEGWKVAGDVTGGIGTSLPAIGAAALLAPVTGGASLVGIGVGALSAAGTSTKEAMQESGELTGKEYLYGAGMGAVEAVTEKLSGGIGAGVTKAAKSVGKAFGKVAAKETAEAAAKSAAKKGVALSLKTAAKSAGKEFASEAFEEGFSEWIAPYIARATYNPNAQSATGEEILYSAFIGGLSGVGMAGGVGAFTQLKNVSSGNEIVNEGRAKQILDLAKRYTEEGFSNTEDAQGIREIYEKLAPAVERGETLNIEQRRMLGELNSFEIAEQLRPTLQRSALTAVQSADAIAERLNADGRYKMVNDKFTYVDSEQSIPEGATVREITAEDITKGYDPSKKDSIREAVKSNDVLRYIAASDAAGRFIMTAKDFEKAALAGQKIQSQADLNLFIENASAEQKAAVGRELGVDDWNTLNIEGLNERTSAYRESGKAEAYKQKTAKIEKMKQLADSKPKSIPRAIALADGDVKHYADADSNIAIARTGDTFLVYDYNTGNVTRDMTRAEVNAELARYRQSKSATSETTNATSEKTSENFSSDAEIEIKDENISKTAFENEFSEEKSRLTVKEIKAANEAKEQAKRFDALAKEKIKDYDGLSEANKSMIRKIFREAEANGISEADALSYARVSARTGLDITFDKKACYNKEKGTYAAGFYDPENNRIVVNPETNRKHASLLIHELSHAIRSFIGNDGKRHAVPMIYDPGKISDEMWKRIDNYYADQEIVVERAELMADEASSYYAEKILGTDAAIELLLGEKPTLRQKILTFFKQSARDYSADAALSREARRLLRDYKALFDRFSARNQGRNAEAGNVKEQSARRFAAETPIITVGMSNSERATILKSKRIKPAEIQQAEYAGFDWEALERNRKSAVEKPLIKKLREFGHLRTYKTDSIDVEFEFTAGGLRKSMNSQVSDYGGTLADLAKVIMNMQKILDSSVLLEIHEDKAKGTPKENQRLLQTYVLLSAFAEGKYITPVQFEIKQYIDNENRLYLAVALSKIEKTGVMDDTALPNGERTRLLPVSEYSISDFIKKINPSDKNFFKYIPDELLTDEQKKAKQNAIAKENAKYHRFSMEEIDPAKMGEPTLPRRAGKANISYGQWKKMKAEYKKGKSYSKTDASDFVDRFPVAGMLTDENKNLITESVWQLLNEAIADDQMTPGTFQEAAHDIAEYFVASLYKGETVTSLDAIDAQNIVSDLKKWISTLDIPVSERLEIKNSAGEHTYKRILGRWAFKMRKTQPNRKSLSLDGFFADLAKKMPELAYLKDMKPAQALVALDEAYEKALAKESERITPAAFLNLSDQGAAEIVSEVEKTILQAYKSGGSEAAFVKRLKKKIDHYEDQVAQFEIKNALSAKTQKLRDLKIGKYANMTQYHNNMFRRSIGSFTNIEWRGTVKADMIKRACNTVLNWYTNEDVKKNILFYTKDDAGNVVSPGLFNEGIADMLTELSQKEGNYNTEDLRSLYQVLTYFTRFVENYGKVYFKGQWVDSRQIAERYINQINANKKLRIGLIGKIATSKFFKIFGDPMSLARRMDFYESGFYTEMLEEMREGAKNAAVYEMELLADYEAFLKENKNYTKKAAETVVTYRDVEITKLHLISLYMTLKRKHARAGFVLNGFEFGEGEGTVDVNGLVDPHAEISEEQIDMLAEAEMKKIESMLSDTDKEFISVLDTIYNEKAKEKKAMRDNQRLGYTNVQEDYYYPLRRIEGAKSLDSLTVYDEINKLCRASFNKSIVEGDKHKLYIEAADALLLRHCRAVSQYAGMQPAFDAYNMLYNLDVSGNPDAPTNVAQVSKTLWADGNSYYKKIIEDMQGAKASGTEGLKTLSFIRSGYAKFQLGANPKVWLTQFSSIFASSSILDADAITKGFFTVKGGDVDKYCELAMLRNHDNTAARAQGVLDQPLSARETKVGKLKRAGNAIVEGTRKLGDFTMMPIGFMDRLVVTRLFAACQAQVAKDQKLAIGTEENKIAAGKLLEKVIFETQQNSLYTERSAAMRSSNEIVRALTMFRSDSMKVFGRVLDAASKIQVLRERIKKAGTKEEKQSLMEERKRAGVSLAKSGVALLTSAAFMVGVAELFRWAYAKDKDEDEKDVARILKDFGGNLLGGLPIFADLYARFVEGYELDNFAYSSINDLANSTASLMSAARDIVSDEATPQQTNRALRSLVYSSCQLLGIPTRNAYNLLYGLTKRVSPGTGYKIDSAFYEKNFKTDLEKAIEKGDDKMAMLTLQLLLGERMGEDIDKAVFDELLSLSKKGMKVLPRVTPDSISINGNVYEFTEDERSEVGRIYEEREEGLKELFASSAYKSLSGEEKEKAVSTVYDLYYDKALSEALGVDRGNKLLFAEAMGFEKYTVFKLKTASIEADTDRKGEKIEGSKRKNTIAAINKLNATREEKLLMIVSSGYALKDGDIRGISAANAKRMLLKYILSMKGTQAEKAALAEACGFEVKNGKILKNSL